MMQRRSWLLAVLLVMLLLLVPHAHCWNPMLTLAKPFEPLQNLPCLE